MNEPNFLILYVTDPMTSATFYTKLLGRPPVESSPTFCLFALGSGMMLGLWARETVTPIGGAPGGGELAIALQSNAEVDRVFQTWSTEGLKIELHPTQLDFGYNFLALDPDGHRLRVFSPTGP